MNFKSVFRVSRRRPLVTMLVILAVGIPIASFAFDVFSDVPSAAIFHEAASAIARAGITAGCSTGLYCPSSNVTRAQMALFLHRGLGRVGKSSFSTTLSPGAGTANTGAITMAPGLPGNALVGAAAFVSASAQMNIYVVDSSGCPCTLAAKWKDETESQTFSVYPNSLTIPAGTNTYSFFLSPSGVAKVSSSAPHIYSLDIYFLSAGTGVFNVYGDAKVEYFPFGNTGTNTFGSGSHELNR